MISKKYVPKIFNLLRIVILKAYISVVMFCVLYLQVNGVLFSDDNRKAIPTVLHREKLISCPCQ